MIHDDIQFTSNWIEHLEQIKAANEKENFHKQNLPKREQPSEGPYRFIVIRGEVATVVVGKGYTETASIRSIKPCPYNQ